MKNRLAYLLVICLMLMTVSCTHNTVSSDETLTESQISSLRKDYPVRPLTGNPNEFRTIFPMDYLLANTLDDWVQVRCLRKVQDIHTYSNGAASYGDENIAAAEQKAGAEFITQNDYDCYEMEVVQSFYGDLKPGDTFRFMAHYLDRQCYPDFMNGETWILGLSHPFHSALTDQADLFWGSPSETFYVVLQDYVLSVVDHAYREEFSGISLKEWGKRMRQLAETVQQNGAKPL